jgi:hypothetical protein
VKALGGGWDPNSLPTNDELARGDAYPRKDTNQGGTSAGTDKTQK